MPKKIYIFGNPDHIPDALPYEFVHEIQNSLPNLVIVYVKPNEDLPFDNHEHAVLIDTVVGITDITIITDENIDKIQLPPRYSAHDFDLGFQLKYLKKLGKIDSFLIIGIPMGLDKSPVAVNRIISLLIKAS